MVLPKIRDAAGITWMIASWVGRNTLSAKLLRGWCGSVARVCGREDVSPHPLAALAPLVPTPCPLPKAARVLSAASDPASTRAKALWFMSIWTWPSPDVDMQEKVRIWDESGLPRFALRCLDAAAKHVGVAPIESLDCGLLTYCCTSSPFRVSVCAPRTLNAAGQSRVTLSLR